MLPPKILLRSKSCSNWFLTLFLNLFDLSNSVPNDSFTELSDWVVEFFDFSKEHILVSVDGILSRLQIDYLDLLALHRPDALMEAEEVAEAFRVLKASG